MKKLFENTGKKIKIVAMVAFIIEALGAVVAGIYLISDYETTTGVLLLLLGPIMSLVINWFIYGFGIIVEQSLKQLKVPSQPVVMGNNVTGITDNRTLLIDKRTAELNDLLQSGLITEEEYRNALNK